MSDDSKFGYYVDRAKEVLSEIALSPQDIRRKSYEYLADKGMPLDQAYEHARRAGENYDAKSSRSGLVYGLNPVVAAGQIASEVPALTRAMQPSVERFQKETAGQEQPQPIYQGYASGGEVDEFPLERAWRMHREGLASGGVPDDMPPAMGHNMPPEEMQPEPEPMAAPAVAPARPRFKIAAAGTAPAKRDTSYEFQKLEPGKANTNTLKMAFDKALDRHLSLPEGERIANSKAAIEALEPHLGKGKTGTPISLLSQNAKLLKAQTGTDDKAPIQLDDGRGIETIGLSLYPDYKEGEFKMCPNSASCRDHCLGKTSGQYSEAFTKATEGAGKVSVRQRAMNRTQAMMRDPEAFAVRLWDDIESARRQAARNGNHLGVRLNTLSDVNPVVYKKLIEAFPDVSFYDYSKMPYKPVAENHHYTYSSTGAEQDGVENPHQNWRKMRNFLDRGDNVAMAFSHKKELPSFVHDEETGKRYRVVNGDEHDFRPLDIQPEGEDGVIVGLKNKEHANKQDTAHQTSGGFFLNYDPKKHGDTVHIKTQPKKGEKDA